MRVCRYWNDVTNSTPSLWTDIVLEEDHAYIGMAHPEVRLDKSKSLPISVSVHPEFFKGNPFTPRTADNLAESWRAVMRHFDRIESLSLVYLGAKQVEKLSPFPSSYPRLSSLKLDAPIDLLKVLGPASNLLLRRITLSIGEGDNHDALWSLPTDELEYLKLGLSRFLLGAEKLGPFLTRSPKLRELYVGYTVSWRYVSPAASPALVTLALESATFSGEYLAVLSSWVAPKLQELSLLDELCLCPKKGALSLPSLVTLDLISLDNRGDDRPTPSVLRFRSALGNLLSGIPCLRRVHVSGRNFHLESLFTLLSTPQPHPDGGVDDEEAEQTPLLCSALSLVVIESGWPWDSGEPREICQHITKFLEHGSRDDLCISVIVREFLPEWTILKETYPERVSLSIPRVY